LVLVDDGIGVRIIRRADGGRRPKTIWGISVQLPEQVKALAEK